MIGKPIIHLLGASADYELSARLRAALAAAGFDVQAGPLGPIGPRPPDAPFIVVIVSSSTPRDRELQPQIAFAVQSGAHIIPVARSEDAAQTFYLTRYVPYLVFPSYPTQPERIEDLTEEIKFRIDGWDDFAPALAVAESERSPIVEAAAGLQLRQIRLTAHIHSAMTVLIGVAAIYLTMFAIYARGKTSFGVQALVGGLAFVTSFFASRFVTRRTFWRLR